MVISTPDQRVRVFVSSTLHELAAERAAVRAAIEGLHLTPVMFELGARPHPPRDLYLAYLRQSQVFVGIYGEQYGWIAPGEQVSGLEDEYLAAQDKPKLVYVKAPAPRRDPRLAALLERVGSAGLSYRSFTDAAELGRLVADDLAVLLSERFAAAEPPPSARWRLPAAPNRLVGRERELSDLHALLTDPAVRMVTLTGPGGVGKTRLALAAAADLREQFGGRVAAVPLAAISSAAAVPAAIAAALRVPETFGRSPQDALADLLASAPALLVLDNFEHVMDAARDVAALLEDAPQLKVLVTSREVLRLSAERAVVVAELSGSQAAELFWERARAVRPDLVADDAGRRAVDELSRRLDGLPLAIELAAARARLLDPTDILARLTSPSARGRDGPSAAPRDLPERQRTLHRTLEWSYDLLDPHDRVLFSRLGVFTGGFALDAVEAVCADDGVPDVLDGLGSLADKSLIRRDGPSRGNPRFTMLGTIREFALERLEDSGDASRRRDLHAGFFLRLAVDAGTRFGHGGGQFVATLDADEANLAAALRWLLDRGRTTDVARMGVALWPVWWVRSRFAEGLAWMTELLSGPAPVGAREGADAHFVVGMLAFGHGDHERAAPALRTARDAYRRLGDRRGAATAAVPLGVIVALTEPDRGEALLRESIAALRDLDDAWGLTLGLFNLGGVLLLGERLADAVPLLAEGAARARALGTRVLLSHTLVHLGWAHLLLSDRASARPPLRDALGLAAQQGDHEGMARALEALAALAVAEGQPEHAARLFGAAEGARRAVGAPLWRPDTASHQRTEQALRAALGEDGYRSASAAGAALPLPDALALAEGPVPTPRS